MYTGSIFYRRLYITYLIARLKLELLDSVPTLLSLLTVVKALLSAIFLKNCVWG